MVSISNVVSLAAIATVSAVAGLSLIPDPQKPFMDVHKMEYSDGQVFAERTVLSPVRIADWRVTVVANGVTAPSCQTVPGMDLHEGWSKYEPGTRNSSMSLDEWVGDPGCFDRLTPGSHTMFVTWTPRDDSPPVTAKSVITIP